MKILKDKAKKSVASIAVGLVSMTALASVSFGAQFVVVKAKGDVEFSLGDILEGQESLLLPTESEMVVINEDGKKIEVEGPYRGSIDKVVEQNTSSIDTGAGLGMNMNIVASISTLMQTAGVEGDDGTVFRSVGELNQASPWNFDATQQALTDYCVASSGVAAFWRASSQSADRITVDAGDGNPVTADWVSGEATLGWPADVALKDGATYSISLASEITPQVVSVHILPDDLPTYMHQAAWMAERNCQQQAVRLVLTSEADVVVGDDTASQ